ncbi:MAG: ABC transporter permease [Alistipes sp.]|nr:ABC transporter permease [Alistipes sp.]
MTGHPFRRLVRQHVGGWQLLGFFATTLAGFAILLGAVQFYCDGRSAIEAPDSLLANDFLILSKEVREVGAGKTFFTREELDRLAEQPFVVASGEFTPARYRVSGGLSMGGLRMSTYLFFESVPDRFLDVASEAWHFEEREGRVPIILPRNYLNLYNFGFASAQGLPQLSEELVRDIPLDIEIAGRGASRRFRGQVAGFSNRLNTILVPETFIRWSNERYADRAAGDPSRVIVEVRDAAEGALHDYLARNGYLVEGDGARSGRAGAVLRLVAGAIAGIGLLITVLAFLILILSLFLVLQKNEQQLEDLLLLGYTPARVARPYQLLAAGLNLAALAGALLAVGWVRGEYLSLVTLFGDGAETTGGIWPAAIAGLGLVGLVAAVDCLMIRRRIDRLWVRG